MGTSTGTAHLRHTARNSRNGEKAESIMFPSFLNPIADVTYTPELADEDVGDGHWSLNIKGGEVTQSIIDMLVAFARAYLGNP
jgi:hypothetical protein